MEISFGDRVRVLENIKTNEMGLSGKVGSVYGFTTPSLFSIDVIGELLEDRAISVSLDGVDEEFWFSSELLEFIDYDEGCEVTVGNVKTIRQSDGTWLETSDEKIRKWWQFW